MTRPLRVEFAGAFYHVLNRGNAGETIFRSNRDREKFLEYWGKAVERFGIKIYTYCLMTNHYHFLIQTPEPNLSRAVQWVNVSYATYFNHKRQRQGHLFQGRFKSILVDADVYLKELSRYIHLNPIRAGAVKQPALYSWSSYPAFIGKAKAPEWLEMDGLLSLFGKTRKEAFQAYRSFVEGVVPAAIENPAKDVVGGCILGGDDFVSWVKDTYLAKRADEVEIPQLKKVRPRPTPDEVVSAVCREYGCDAEWIVEKGRKKNSARDMAIYLARELTGASGAQLGRYFGDITGAAITVRYNRVVKEVSRNEPLKGRADQIKRRIINI
jgi:REP element-mobilizing transposase RayT